MVNDLFLREDLAKPENRVNVALFAMMQQHWFRKWFLKKLDLPIDAIVYPPTNRDNRRPDLKVVNPDHVTLAYIEIELSEDTTQLEDYQQTFPKIPVRSICGKRSHGGKLSLEDIAQKIAKRLKDRAKHHPQIRVNMQQLSDLICEGLKRHSPSPGRSRLSPGMRTDELVVKLYARLKNRIQDDLRPRQPPLRGRFKIDTTATQNNQGFSLRVYSPESSDHTLSIMSISGGEDRVRFPSLKRLEKYLPGRSDQIRAYEAVLCRMKLSIRDYEINQRPWLSRSTVLTKLDELVPCLQALADCYVNRAE